MLFEWGHPRGKEEEGRKMVLIQTSSVEENAPLKAKNGVRLNHAQRRGNVAEERPLVLVYQGTNCPYPNSQCRRKRAPEGKERSTTELYTPLRECG